MDKATVIALADKTGLFDYLDLEGDSVGQLILQNFAALVAAHEREECAKVCGGMVDAEYKTGKVDHNEMGWTQACAIAIRSRT